MPRFRKLAIALFASGVLVHAIGALLALPFGNVDLSQLLQPGSYLFFSLFAAAPFLVMAVLSWSLASRLEERPAMRKAFAITTAAVALLGLAAQVECWRTLDSDAQAAIGFVVLPIAGGVVAFIIGAVSLAVAMIVGRKRRGAS